MQSMQNKRITQKRKNYVTYYLNCILYVWVEEKIVHNRA
jgi:hypothetical protein